LRITKFQYFPSETPDFVLELFIAILLTGNRHVRAFMTSRLREAPAPKPPLALRRAASADQRLRIQEWLTMGLTVAHIARVEQLTAPRAPQIISEMLASRETDPPAGFVQLQIARLSEAMIVARTIMMQGNLQSVDRWIELTSGLNRYHGFSPDQILWARDAAAPPASPRRSPCAISSGRGVCFAGIAPREGLTAKTESLGNGAATA
jgi:hypothetical protein